MTTSPSAPRDESETRKEIERLRALRAKVYAQAEQSTYEDEDEDGLSRRDHLDDWLDDLNKKIKTLAATLTKAPDHDFS